MVGVAWLGSDSSMQAFVKRHGLTFSNLRDDTGDLFARFDVPGQPAWVFVRPDGTSTRALGALGDDELRGTLDDLAAG